MAHDNSRRPKRPKIAETATPINQLGNEQESGRRMTEGQKKDLNGAEPAGGGESAKRSDDQRIGGAADECGEKFRTPPFAEPPMVGDEAAIGPSKPSRRSRCRADGGRRD